MHEDFCSLERKVLPVLNQVIQKLGGLSSQLNHEENGLLGDKKLWTDVQTISKANSKKPAQHEKEISETQTFPRSRRKVTPLPPKAQRDCFKAIYGKTRGSVLYGQGNKNLFYGKSMYYSKFGLKARDLRDTRQFRKLALADQNNPKCIKPFTSIDGQSIIYIIEAVDKDRKVDGWVI